VPGESPVAQAVHEDVVRVACLVAMELVQHIHACMLLLTLARWQDRNVCYCLVSLPIKGNTNLLLNRSHKYGISLFHLLFQNAWFGYFQFSLIKFVS